MIDDLAAYELESEFEADLCIVGAGAAGLSLAHEFIGSQTRVMVVESGGLEPDPETDRLNEGEVDGIAAAALVAGRSRGFGGTTALWAGQCIPLDEIDFSQREWVPHSGWPIARDELVPYYERAEHLMGVPGETYDARLWDRWRTVPPALDPERIRHTYTAWSPRPHLGRALGRAFRRAANVRVLLHANVTAIETEGAAFSRLVVRHVDGTRGFVRARCCVLAAGAIENARLLLASELGNEHGNVGRFFQDHPNAHSARLTAADPRALQGPYSLFYRRGGRRYLPKLALTPAVQRREKVLNCAANLEYEFGDEGMNAVRRIYRRFRSHDGTVVTRADLRAAAGALPAAAAAAERRFVRGRSSLSRPAAIWVQVHCEQAPNRDSRVLLSRERDAVGLSRARVEWRLGALEERTAEVMTATLDRELRRLGLASSEPEPVSFGDSYHHLGTTRMAGDPADGVVDSDCQVHGVPGLYVSGGSVFPTSGFANPTLSIVALALRLGDHLRTRLASRP